MKRFTLIFQLFLSFQVIFAQCFDDFSDGDFSSNPCWVGDTGVYVVNELQELQLNAPSSGSAALFLPCSATEEQLEWRFRIRFPFAPSLNNFAKVYLLTNSYDLSAPDVQCYYLQFGENQALDAIELFYQKGNQHTSLCRGPDAQIANPFNLSVKVLKPERDHWQIFVDELQNGAYQQVAEAVADSLCESIGLGLFCQFTSTNKDKFFFDDFYFGPPIVDTLPPQVVNVLPTQNLRQLEVHFSEKVTSVTASLSDNYKIAETDAHPITATFIEPYFDRILLTFEDDFQNKMPYHLHVSGVCDVLGNCSEAQHLPFSFFKLERHSVLITEILADPFPEVGLPPAEYLELYNRETQSVILRNWKLKIGNTIRLMPDVFLEPSGFAMLVSSASVSRFSDFSSVCGVPGLALPDAGQALTLLNEFDEVICYVDYKQKWHDNAFKSEGGWSLEMVDVDNPCAGSENWRSSVASAGGTPTAPNSVATINPDMQTPDIQRVIALDSLTLQLVFSETMLPQNLNGQELFDITPHINLLQMESHSVDNRIWRVKLANPLQINQLYTLSLRDSLCDCAGLPVPYPMSWQFGLAQPAAPNDLIINEILTNPFGSDDADFIEIYNRSDKIIDLRKIRIGSGGTVFPEKSALISGEGFALFPKSYVAVCKNRALTETHYICPNPKQMLQCDSLPPFNNDKGVVFLTDLFYNIIDKFIYDETMHSSMLTSVDGVSLERVHFDLPTQDAANWKSAASSCGFATPAYQNSQFVQPADNQQLMQIVPEIISPDNDGFEDFATIYCQFPTPECRATISIYDQHGNLVKLLTNNQLCAVDERFVWDGVSDRGVRVPPNLYIVKLQFWNQNGRSKSVKKVIGVARK